jgi:hypothetical protein
MNKGSDNNFFTKILDGKNRLLAVLRDSRREHKKGYAFA